MTLKIRSKADLKSKSQTIWQQIILFSRTANDMRVTQDLNSFREIIAHAHCSVDEKNFGCKSKNIFRVYHIRIIAQKKNGSHDMKQTNSSIIIARNVCVLTSASMIVYLFVTSSWSAIMGIKQPKVDQSPQQWRGR